VLPGLPASLAQSEGALRPAEHEMKKELIEIVRSKGFRVQYDKVDESYSYHIVEKIMNYSRLVRNDKYKTKAQILDKFDRIAKKYGHTLENPEEIRLEPDFTESDVHELTELLIQTAKSKGYKLYIDNFIGFLAILNEDESIKDAFEEYLGEENDDGETRHVLQEKCFIFKLPYVRLNLETFHPNYVGNSCWTISPAKGRSHSDYEDNIIWCTKCVATNLSMLITNRLSGIVSTLILTPSGETIITPDGETPRHTSENTTIIENVRQLCCLQECAVDVTQGKSIDSSDDSVLSIKEAILKSFSNPQFGDIENELRVRLAYNPCVFEVIDQPEPVWNPEEFYTRIILERLEEARKKLTGVTWRLNNPGTQWTSSINPIIAHPRDWYGERYVSFRLGCEPVETCLRLMRLRDGIWKILPRDIFRKIVILVVWNNSFIAWIR